MTIPFEPEILGIRVNVHLILEYLAFFVAFRYYLFQRRRSKDPIPDKNRWSILLGAITGAFIGSRVIAFLENPLFPADLNTVLQLLHAKSVMGGLAGGLAGVELTKQLIRERHSSGDLFTLPLITGIIIGRMGCFLNGIKEFTYGTATGFITGMDLGDGITRHPIALYEIFFLLLLFLLLKSISSYTAAENGLQFKIFMISYFGFRFILEFIKPNVFYLLGLSSIQWLCISCWLYYTPTLIRLSRNAIQKVYVL